MSKFKEYTSKSVKEMRDYVEGEILDSNVSISDADLKNRSPKPGDKIARNPENHEDQWLVSKAYFDNNLEEIKRTSKSLTNTDSDGATKRVKDIVFWGNGDLFKLIGKASSKAEAWMKSTKAMEIEGVGCVVQITTQQDNQVAEAVTFVPLVRIQETKQDNKVISRKLVSI